MYRKSNDAAFGEALSLALQKLGPVYIKLGQTLSTRADIIGPDLASSLAGLQDKLPPFSHDKAIKIFESETGRQIADIFAEFDKAPVAAASIAQVHKATLQGG
ncbi:MAG: AarF/UbiB family protein, partial [Pseudomonadota bacterium]